MTLLIQVVAAAVLFLALPYAASWVFKFLYGFFRPLDEVIREDRLREFEFAGYAAGLALGTIVAWWLDHQFLIQ
ncbi:hypothetical protein SEA_HUBBS_67 [Microbacterium phage Hubbs]|nr:hypothetical protein SEA_HUBBS_67 [Microbacterium phage Hubbs]